MIHDEKHEVRQDEAIRALASMVAALAHRQGASDMEKSAKDIDTILAADETEGEAPAVEVVVPAEEPKV